MESVLRATPTYEQLIKELDDLKKKVYILENGSGTETESFMQSYEDKPLFKVYSNKNSNLDLENKIKLDSEEGQLLKYKEKLFLEVRNNEFLIKELAEAKKHIELLNQRIAKDKERTKKIIGFTKMLKSSNADLQNFIYAASHDLRSPISNLEGLVNILINQLGGKIQESELSLFKMIKTSISRFKQTIFDLTELTTLQKQVEECIEPVNFSEIVEDVKINIQNKITESEAVIKTDFQVQQIYFARKNLTSIIFNLLSNAIKYRSLNRPLQIKLSTRKKGKYIIFDVADNGLGFLPEQKDKLFQMFKRLHTHVDGTGVGLYIVKKIVENSGGRIEVESELDKGSKFKIFLKIQSNLN
jgi:signal transduction histidine kinase